MSQGLWIWTLQLLDDLEALVQLSEHIHHGAGEEGVLRRLLELSKGSDVEEKQTEMLERMNKRDHNKRHVLYLHSGGAAR